jgi:cell division septum initiation protein DivIVA
MSDKKEVKEDFNLEFLGYKKNEVDEFVNKLAEKLEVLTKDVEFLKSELKRYGSLDEKILKRVDE